MKYERLSADQNFPACTKYTYLDAASIALMYKGASEATRAWQQNVADNGTVNFTEQSEQDIFDDLRLAVANLIGACSEDVAIGSSTTELLSSLAWAMIPESKKNIIGTEASFPTTLYPWLRVARTAGCDVQLAKIDKWGGVNNEELLALINDQTSIVALSHVEYRTGQTYKLNGICKKAHYHGAKVVIDATQSAGQLPIDVKDSHVDAIVSSGYKWLCGPFGAAFLYVAPELQKDLDPGIVGWRSHENIWDLDVSRLKYADSARRFEAGTMAYGSAVGLAQAIAHLNDIGVNNILKHNMALNAILENEMLKRGAVPLIPKSERSSILSMYFPDQDSEFIAQRLNDSNVFVSFRNTLRISPHLYNNEHDIERSIEVLDNIFNKK